MWTLFLDDLRDPILTYPNEDTLGWLIARDFNQGIKLVKEFGIPNRILFDHDLGVGPTGYDFVLWMIVQHLDGTFLFPSKFEFSVHSMNPIGAENIKQTLTKFLEHIK